VSPRPYFLCLAVAGLLIAASGPLAVVNPIISDSEGGAALSPTLNHVPGETLFFSFLVDGYHASSADKVHLAYKAQVTDPQGVPIIEPVTAEIEETLAPEDKAWKPRAHFEILIPPLAGSGTYKIAISLTDEIAKASATKEVTFQVRGQRVDPSDTLVIRNFGFYRSDEDAQPLVKAVYHPGSSVWARFDIIGFKYGEGNAIDVSYGVTLLAPGGKVLWSQADAASDKSQSFYPKRYVPGAMSLNLQPNIRPGEYTMVVTARDQIGNQTCESREVFRIE